MTGILDVIEQAARASGTEILFAGERGSRCFGTEDGASDYDAVAYVRSPLRDYVRMNQPLAAHPTLFVVKDSLSLFDVRRALHLTLNSNISVWHTINSTLVHKDEMGLRDAIEPLYRRCHNDRTTLFQHGRYLAQALRAMDIRGSAPGKAWLHAVIPMLAFRHVRRESRPAPVGFTELVSGEQDATLVEASLAALADKHGGTPLHAGLAEAIVAEATRIATEMRSLDDPARELNRTAVREADEIAYAMIGAGFDAPMPGAGR